MAANHFDSLNDPQNARREAMRAFYQKNVDAPTQEKDKEEIDPSELLAAVEDYVHELNWLRKKHGGIGDEEEEDDWAI